MKKALAWWLPLVVFAIVVAFVLSPSSSGAAGEKSKHVMIIGVDGAAPAAVRQAKTPNLDALVKNGTVTWDGFAGGVLGTPSRQNTASLASWNSILTGVWANKHKATRMMKGRPLPPDHAHYPCFFKRVKEADPKAQCASIVNWPTINTQSMVPEADHKARGENDEQVCRLVAKYLQDADPAVVFIQLDEVDGAGHGNGYTAKAPKYVEALEKADKHVGQLVEAVKARKNYANEDWLFIVVTDHGGKANAGGGHGGDSPEERTIFLIVSGDGAKKGVESPGPGIVAVAPTALKFLGVAIDPKWDLDGKPFGLKD